MKQFFLTMAGVFAGLILFFVFIPIVLLASLSATVAQKAAARTPAASVLSLDLRKDLTDQDGSSLSIFRGGKLSVLKIVQTLHAAETDSRIRGLFIRLPEGGMAPGEADELKLAIRRFRAAGKPVIAHSQGLAPSGMVVSTYMVGAATGDLWMQDNASFQATGLATEDMFYKRAFDKYGVKADYQQRYEYKNAVNPYLYDDYTPAHREATLGWMNSVYDSAVDAAAVDRKKGAATLKAALEACPCAAEDARAKGLIDGIGDVEAAQADILKRAGDDAKLIEFSDYNPPAHLTGPAIAVIGAEGAIVTGTDKNAGLSSSHNVYSDDLSRAFRDAAKDDSVKAIVFRVNSPGGSDTASEQIRDGMLAAKAAGKPVVVSMGTYAASGGYWISADASSIVAEPSTLTGSIGVFGGKFVLGDALARFGIDTRDITVGGQYADAFSSATPFTPTQRASVTAWMDRIYDGFVTRVAAGRRLSPDRVREIAKGRVWTGEQAKGLGLVDQIGGFYDAVDRAKALAGLPVTQDVRFKRYPGEQSPWTAVSKAFGVSAVAARTLIGLGGLLNDPKAEALITRAGDASLSAQGQAMTLAPRSAG